MMWKAFNGMNVWYYFDQVLFTLPSYAAFGPFYNNLYPFCLFKPISPAKPFFNLL